MNIKDFIESIKIELEDLEYMGDNGYISGITSIFNKKMNTLDITERPIHCTDQKRNTMYIKDANIWEKDDDDKSSTRKAVKRLTTKSILSLNKFREKYPGCETSDSRHSDKYNTIVREAYGGIGDNMDEKENKIIHNISKKLSIEKIKI